MAELVVQALEIIDVEQGDRHRSAAPVDPGAFDLERLHQAAPVRHLGQLVGRDFVGQAPEFRFEMVDDLREFAGPGVLSRDPLAGLRHRGVNAAAFGHHLAHHTGQALERIGRFDHAGIASHAVLETAGLQTEFTEIGQHAGDQPLERVARVFALDAQPHLVFAGLRQQLADRAHTA